MPTINSKYHRHLTTIDLDEDIVYVKSDMRPVSSVIYNDGKYPYEINYKEGKNHGTGRCWHSNGQIWSEKNYKKGVLHGMSRHWYENGIQQDEEKYENGNRIYKRSWEKDGSEIDASDPNFKWLFE